MFVFVVRCSLVWITYYPPKKRVTAALKQEKREKNEEKVKKP